LHLPWLSLLVQDQINELAGIPAQVNTAASAQAMQISEKPLKYYDLETGVSQETILSGPSTKFRGEPRCLVGKAIELWHV
jgi:hypothetical protein